MTDTSNEMIHVENLVKSFTLHNQGGVTLTVLENVSFSVERGECIILAGPSGSGKSTLLRSLYANYLPQSGKVEVRHDDELLDLVTAPPHVVLDIRARTLGYVSQFLRVIPRVSTLDLVMEPLLARGMDERGAREKAATLLTRLRIPESLWSLPPATFSGGEQQRVNIAMTLILDYPVLLLDEPTASLDAENRQTVVDLINEAREGGAAIVGIFHDSQVREAVGTRTYTLEEARKAA
ncbi:phosphonate C-P lyase system protein PhnL [Nisaea acidiphila]|uniref:Phosphonate C-P lyase system protein PhnL n=1 Tax=Nisaea acidiphila TaxID=1862145 RepID=A0A9J7AS16_9PROT|nr:phosphonate C-P lyase system protein PhnL [Nisaea acidiphila]UUX50006.1 phosphonate C-P lyase system protein PhnL [Nisaea acidiphila]